VYKLLRLNKRRKGKRRIPARVKQPLVKQEHINQSWSMDFMSDSIVGGRKFRTLNVIDDCTREALAIEIDTSLSAKRVTRTLDRLIIERGKPVSIRVDNGPEFTSHEYMLWCKSKDIHIQYIQPGKPMQNGYIERFNRLYREAVLDAYLFFGLEEVKVLTEQWIEEYNERRPHEALQNMTPVEWREKILKEKDFLFQAPGFIGTKT
jgi:putative transposase